MRNPGLPTSRAAGFVLSRVPAEGAEREYLLLSSRRDGMPGFPKGHADGGEDDLSTAWRETREETGLVDLEPDPSFRTEVSYRVKKGPDSLWKTVVYFRATLRSGDVRLSDEHTGHLWLPVREAAERISFDSLRHVLLDAALHAKDPGLFRRTPPDVVAADRHLASLPEAHPDLLEHLRGAARLARGCAQALAAAGVPVNPAAAEVGALLHDAGRAIGRHDDHQVAGVELLRGTPLAAYAFACISHFTKGARAAELVEAGLPRATVERFRRQQAIEDTTAEEVCVALADSCMRGRTAVPPAERFADLRRRYGPSPLIDLQERRTGLLRAHATRLAGTDPLAAFGL